MDQSSVDQRLKMNGVDTATLARLKPYRAFIAKEAEAVIAEVISKAVGMTGNAKLAPLAAEKAKIDAAHFETICRGEFGADYLESLTLTHDIAVASGSGARGRSSTSLGVMTALIAEIGRRRWSRREILRDCEAMLKVFMTDIVFAIMMDQSEMRNEYEARRSSLTEVTTVLSDNASTMSASLETIVAALTDHTGITTRNAEASRTTADNLHEVASTHAAVAKGAAMAAAEMSAAMEEIQQSSRRSADTAQEAVSDGRNAARALERLHETIGAIDEFAGIISDVAAQTNLLALNATIEAARAGEAGRGFAVVAHEIKGLAGQVEQSSASITRQVEAIRHSVEETSRSVVAVEGKIETMAGFASAITQSVDQQKEKTADIANHVGHTASQMLGSAELAVTMRTNMQATLDAMRRIQETVGELIETSKMFAATTTRTTDLLANVK